MATTRPFSGWAAVSGAIVGGEEYVISAQPDWEHGGPDWCSSTGAGRRDRWVWASTRFTFALEELGPHHQSQLQLVVRDLSTPGHPETVVATYNSPLNALALDEPQAEQFDLTPWQGREISLEFRMNSQYPVGNWFRLDNPRLDIGIVTNSDAGMWTGQAQSQCSNLQTEPWLNGDMGTPYTPPASGPGCAQCTNPSFWEQLGEVVLAAVTLGADAANDHRGPAPQGVTVHSIVDSAGVGGLEICWTPYQPSGGMGANRAGLVPLNVSYEVYRDGVLLGVKVTGTSFTDTGVIEGQPHSYTVAAVINDPSFQSRSQGAESEQSRTVTATRRTPDPADTGCRELSAEPLAPMTKQALRRLPGASCQHGCSPLATTPRRQRQI